MTKREKIWMLNEEYVGYCQRYKCAYLHYKDAHVCNI